MLAMIQVIPIDQRINRSWASAVTQVSRREMEIAKQTRCYELRRLGTHHGPIEERPTGSWAPAAKIV